MNLKKNVGKLFTSKSVGTEPSSYEKKNLPGRGLTKIEKHRIRRPITRKRLCFFHQFRGAVGPTQTLAQWVSGKFSPVGRESESSLLRSTNFKKLWSHTFTTLYIFPAVLGTGTTLLAFHSSVIAMFLEVQYLGIV